MQTKTLYDNLKKAYSQENLNRLSSDIINLYKQKDVSRLRQIHAIIFNGKEGDAERISRVFARIITLYHPDRLEQTVQKLQVCFEQNDFEGLKAHDHILDVQKLDLAENDQLLFEDDFDDGDIWDFAATGYSYIDDEERVEEDDFFDDSYMPNDFIAAVKRKVYGHLRVQFPVNLLADIEIVEMAGYEIENLEGVEYCTYARIIDLSGNNLTEVYNLAQLLHLEEAYLQNNHISYLDGLNELPFLRVLDLSHNHIDDISPLFELDSLEFLNVMGNRIPDWQIEKMALTGVVIVA